MDASKRPTMRMLLDDPWVKVQLQKIAEDMTRVPEGEDSDVTSPHKGESTVSFPSSPANQTYIEPHELDISEYIEPYSELNISTTSSTSSPTASSTSRPHRVHRALQRARHLDLHRVLPDRPPASTANQRAQHLRALQRAQQSLTRTTTTTPIVMGGVHPRQPSVLCTPTL